MALIALGAAPTVQEAPRSPGVPGSAADPRVPPAPEAPAAPIAAAVDSRVEFLSAVARNAGFDEYRMPSAASPYAEAVDALFAARLDHPAFERMRAMRRKHGLSYDAVMSLALHVGAPPELVERVPLSSRPPRLDRRLETAPTRLLLKDLRDLAAKVEWTRFAAAQAPRYAAAAERLAHAANATPIAPWFERALGARPGASVVLVPGLLTGGSNYGVGARLGDGSPEEIRPIIGCRRWDAAGLPVFGADIVPLVAHELCHSYTNAIVDRHAVALKPIGERLYRGVAGRMERQAYGTWQTMMYETFVRMMVVRFLRDTQGAEAADRLAAEDVAAGFAWVPDLAAALDPYMADRARYPTLDAFVPEIVAVLRRHADARAEAPPAPVLVRSDPPDGAADLPPGGARLVLEFDQPMRTDTYSVTGAVRDLPANIVLEGTERGGRVWRFAMLLEADRAYTIGLNGGSFRGFRGANGTPLEFTMIRFRTGPRPAPRRGRATPLGVRAHPPARRCRAGA